MTRSTAIATLLLAALVWPATAAAQLGLGRSQPLSNAHSHLDTSSKCFECHEKGRAGQPRGGGVPVDKCLKCHDDIAKRMNNKRGFHNAKVVRDMVASPKGCWGCHYDHLQRTFDMINGRREGKGPAWPEGTRDKFNHDQTGYRLIGGHRGLDCFKCHKKTFKRPKSQTQSFLGNNPRCLSCHENYHKFKDNDPLNDCQRCHNFASWKKFNLPIDFNHNNTSFPLRGAHKKIQCQTCHPKGKPFAPLAHDRCESCHAKDNPHGPKTFASRACIYCHTEIRWKNSLRVSTKQHKAKLSKNDYDPKGAHLKLGCAQCHRNVKTTPKDGECTSCHNNIHGETWVRDDKKCTKCHEENVWETLLVKNADHKGWSKFELKGQHLEVMCLKCHRGAPSQVPKDHECASCHTDTHKGSRGPNCTKCHSEKGWEGELVVFDHDQTRFPLRQSHTSVACEQCHPDPGTFKQRDHSCRACHGSPHGPNLSDKCDDCHDAGKWEDEKFDHNSQTTFRLSGRHIQVPCFKCHRDITFNNTPHSCRICHWDYHDGEWGVSECKECHSTATWLFDRRRVIYENLHNFGNIVLAGAHEKLPCETCHAPNPRFLIEGLGGECVMCHTDVHFGALGNECQECHRQQEWLPSTFRHATTGFPLTGAHRVAACRDCHKNNVFGGTPDECVFCHSDDIARSAHGLCAGATFCTDCHNTVTWTQQRSLDNPCQANPATNPLRRWMRP